MLNKLHLLPTEQPGDITPEQCTAMLSAQLNQGKSALSVCCPAADGTMPYRFLRTAVDFLLDHPEIERLDLFCRENDLPAYRFQWNMWFAERRGD